MTRVNLIDPIDLTDQHLIAERLELTFVVSSAARSFGGRKGLQVNDSFVLGPGHVSFFHNKLTYIKNRFAAITNEMINRDMKPVMEYPDVIFPTVMMKDYVPTKEDYLVIVPRITERINLKPTWYRYRGIPIDEWFVYRYLKYVM